MPPTNCCINRYNFFGQNNESWLTQFGQFLPGRDWLLYGEEYGRTKFGNCQKLPFNDASNWAQNTKFT